MADFYKVEDFELREGIGFLLAMVRKRTVELLDAEFAAFGLKGVQAFVLVGIANGLPTAASFCKLLQHDPGAMTRVVDRLEKAGLLRRVRAAGDRRKAHLELTDAGRKTLPRIKVAAVKVFNQLLRPLSHAEAKQLISLLKRLAEDER